MNTRLHNWCHRQGAYDHQSKLVVEGVMAKYKEAHRSYHHLDHIRSSLAHLDRLGWSDDLLEGAIWFHDVIYDPSRSDNEAASARFFETSTSPWIDQKIQGEITRLILATNLRNPRTADLLEILMVDIDLTILGSDSASYETYRHDIRREYQHIPETDFKRGRAAILEHLLAGKIYLSTDFQHLEPAARKNLANELADLTDPME